MDLAYLNNPADIEGLKAAREIYPDFEIPVFQDTVTSAELHATLRLLNPTNNTDTFGTNSSLRNINGSNLGDLCSKMQQQPLIDIDLELGLASVLGITSFLLSVSNPVSAAAVGIASIVLPILWPTSTPAPNDVWKSLSANAEALIDEKLSEYAINKAVAKLEGIKKVYNAYAQDVAILNAASPDDPFLETKKQNVRTRWIALDSYFLFSMPQFRYKGFEIQLLPTYAEAANLHLLMKRDRILFGSEWGEAPDTIVEEKIRLQECRTEYTDHCLNTFNKGLTNLATASADLQNCQRYPWIRYNQYNGWTCSPPPENTCNSTLLTCTSEGMANPSLISSGYRNSPEYRFTSYRYSVSEYQGLEAWNVYNNFRRDMTIMVLDIVATWKRYDSNIVTNKKGIKFELPRTLYTPIRGTTYRSDSTQNTLTKIEERMILKPSLFNWLEKVKGWEYYVAPVGGYCKQFTAGRLLTGMEVTIRKTLDTNSIKVLEGNNNSTYQQREVTLTPDSSITSVHTRQWFEPREIGLYKGNEQHQFTFGTIEERSPEKSGDPEEPHVYPKEFIYDPTAKMNRIAKMVEPNNPNTPKDQWKNSHRLAYLNYEPIRSDTPFGYPSQKQIGAVALAWTHMLVDPKNKVDSERITLIPAVKAISTTGSVIKGLGCTGGDLIELKKSNTLTLKVTLPATADSQKKIRAGLIYASNQNVSINMQATYSNATTGRTITLAPTYSSGNLACGSFQNVIDILTGIAPLSTETLCDVVITNNSTSEVTITIDSIVFEVYIPTEKYEGVQKLETARNVVNALFTDDTNQRLKENIMGSDLDIAINMVEEIPSDAFQKEKIILQDRVKQAKRLSQSRNLLQYGDFDSPYWSRPDGWTASNGVSVQYTNSVLPGNYLNLPGARDPLSNGIIYPSYIYQKVEESKLKPYTRYWIRGLIENSQDLKLVVSRYQKEIDKTINVPNDLNQASLQSHLNSLANADMSCGLYSPLLQTTGNTNEQPHIFFCPIDIGELNFCNNPGILVALRVNSVNGGAQVGHMELVEGAPLNSEEVARMKRQEEQWKKKREQMYIRDQESIQAAQMTINNLFASPAHGRLKLETTFQDIVYAQTLVNAIPNRYNPAFPEIPGVNMSIFSQLQNQLQMAQGLYNIRNVVVNGKFISNLANWQATEGVEIEKRDGTSVAVLSYWSANISQELCVAPEQAYLLRVTARKEGSGKGYVTISDCTKANTETLAFISEEETTASTPSLENTSIKTASTGEKPYVSGKRTSATANPYGDRNQQMQYSSNNYEMNMYPSNTTNYQGASYPSSSLMTAEQSYSLSNFVTKTVEIFPETNRVRIEIGETAGTFIIESVEIIPMGC